MGLLFPVLVLLVLVGFVKLLFSALGTAPGRPSRQRFFRDLAPPPAISGYELVPSVLTPAEGVFARVLYQIDMPEYFVLSKVRLADFVNVRKGMGDEGKTAFFRISQKHVDFLVVGRSDFRPVLAIELDDASHESTDRKRRDDFVNAIYRQVGLPILHVPVRVSYSPVDLAAQMEGLVFQPGSKEGTGTKAVLLKAISW